ncbi:hypothetical protein [Owenweeksia hongkongensis]|uniref:hypothetical protein n=1 Tax=Owenweeksia hongkongensis TaxID=253245 RepID=UPI003A959A87
MDITQLLAKLNQLKGDNKKETDEYLEALKQYVASQAGSEWSPEHQQIFGQMRQRVSDNRIYKWIISGLVVVLLAGGIFIALNMAGRSSEIALDKSFIDLARQSTLPLEIVKIDSTGDWVNVKISENYHDLKGQNAETIKELIESFPSLGRLYGLNKDKPLKVNFSLEGNDEGELVVTYGNPSTAIGKVVLDATKGKIWPVSGASPLEKREMFNLKEPIPYLNDKGQEMDFSLEIDTFVNGRWKLTFMENGIKSQPFNWQKTKDGSIEESVFIVSQKGWKHPYAVTLGIGRPGAESDTSPLFIYAWNVRSYAHRLQF